MSVGHARGDVITVGSPSHDTGVQGVRVVLKFRVIVILCYGYAQLLYHAYMVRGVLPVVADQVANGRVRGLAERVRVDWCALH